VSAGKLVAIVGSSAAASSVSPSWRISSRAVSTVAEGTPRVVSTVVPPEVTGKTRAVVAGRSSPGAVAQRGSEVCRQ